MMDPFEKFNCPLYDILSAYEGSPKNLQELKDYVSKLGQDKVDVVEPLHGWIDEIERQISSEWNISKSH